MQIEKVEKIKDVIENGITMPLDGYISNRRAVIKTFNNSCCYKILTNELVCLKMAQILELPIPNGGICSIDRHTKVFTEEVYLDDILGIGFYSERLNKVNRIILSSQLIKKYIINKEDIIKIMLFDHLIYNKDRHVANMLIDVASTNKDKKMYIIDHTHVFHNPRWNDVLLEKMIKEDDLKDDDIMQSNAELYGVFIESISIRKESLLQAAEFFRKKLNEKTISDILGEIPHQWNIKKRDKEMLLKYILYRLQNLDTFCEVIYNFIKG